MRCVKPLLALTLALCPLSHVMALPSDSSQPIRIQANGATLDDKRNTAVYTGNVVITQGSLRLTGSRVTLTTNANGELNTMVTQGGPATYQQTPEANKPPVKARAETIEYHADRETIVLIKNAFLEQSGNTFQGEHVSYDIQRQVVDAGQSSSGASGSEGGGRIEIVIQPRSRSAETPSEEPAAP
ncbi:lipopolysaccharide export system protein LptA [Halopseudomonas oceani]|uniref:Lipopolysaccharide export system protein LptA n=2 Tax=Halopseudomonas oceani TaxID=1708783 RepID=A0A2P4EQW3_9GAMM|nr:lipopolysaccharide transport periplasmic protein LptA [Halopseudomonas oceani]POB01019.1 lipopolysaccharide transport periplasmic protein LptA [Halopseudomonas oceani]GGE48571.1 lipopolysaccharide export system protein LptA [Halopseudomonas oceani]